MRNDSRVFDIDTRRGKWHDINYYVLRSTWIQKSETQILHEIKSINKKFTSKYVTKYGIIRTSYCFFFFEGRNARFMYNSILDQKRYLSFIGKDILLYLWSIGIYNDIYCLKLYMTHRRYVVFTKEVLWIASACILSSIYDQCSRINFVFTSDMKRLSSFLMFSEEHVSNHR